MGDVTALPPPLAADASDGGRLRALAPGFTLRADALAFKPLAAERPAAALTGLAALDTAVAAVPLRDSAVGDGDRLDAPPPT